MPNQGLAKLRKTGRRVASFFKGSKKKRHRQKTSADDVADDASLVHLEDLCEGDDPYSSTSPPYQADDRQELQDEEDRREQATYQASTSEMSGARSVQQLRSIFEEKPHVRATANEKLTPTNRSRSVNDGLGNDFRSFDSGIMVGNDCSSYRSSFSHAQDPALAALHSKLDILVSTMQDMCNRQGRTDGRLDNLVSDVAALSGNHKRLSSTMQDMNPRLDNISTSMTSISGDVTTLSNRTNAMQRGVDTISNTTQAIQVDVKTISNKSDVIKAGMDSIATEAGDVDQLSAAHIGLSADVQDLGRSHDRLQLEHKGLSADVQDMGRSHDRLWEEHGVVESRVDTLSAHRSNHQSTS